MRRSVVIFLSQMGPRAETFGYTVLYCLIQSTGWS